MLIRRLYKIVFFPVLISLFLSCGDNIYIHSTSGLIVILKADDLGDTTANWNRFVKLLVNDSICAGIGIISQRVHDTSIPEIQRISTLSQDNGFPVVEFWNHGYDHKNLKSHDAVTEFSNTNFNYQYKHFQLAQHFFSDSLHITSHAFGAPHNRSDGNTENVIIKSPEINVWQQYRRLEHYNERIWKDPKYRLINPHDQHIILTIDYLSLYRLIKNDFERNYARDSKKPYILIQIHPAIWNDAMFTDFDSLVHFYRQVHKVRFMTPYQYYQFLHTK